ncbi:hypothetical protein D3P07_15685 [Paenibacillus sp. 1011MAR3C5]|uniref:hypothetical protein n=1 Tax=Paenibacillus sp. 1011MAR3C5 TaxID=1675787 RepID=UPI000E6BD9C0|nr:hypothetical protein [Paenibacillus sp. 1011MAR3C5]RJE87741.1 hypothetical protein D3P07_15685 [Paenibacillus sp. 1011MAR3C5]
MYKLVLILAMMSLWMTVHLMQVEEEMAMKSLSQGKRAINRAAHAAAQQVDKAALSEGIIRIDESAASREAALYLQRNLQLDEGGRPLPNSFLRHPVQVLVFEVINSEERFPYRYWNPTYNYEVELRSPGVVIIAKVVYPRAFTVMEPLEWEIRGAAELVAG